MALALFLGIAIYGFFLLWWGLYALDQAFNRNVLPPPPDWSQSDAPELPDAPWIKPPP